MAGPSLGTNHVGESQDERPTPRRATPRGATEKRREGATPKAISSSSKTGAQQTVPHDSDIPLASGSGKAYFVYCAPCYMLADHGLLGLLSTVGQEKTH